MKIHLAFLFLIFMVDVNGQNLNLFTIDSVSKDYIDVSLANGFELYPLDLYFQNVSNDTLQLRWRREFDSNCPSEWIIHVADPLLSYPPHIDTSVLVIQVNPGDSNLFLRQNFMPNFTPGCCDSKIIFYLASDPNITIDTAYYHLGINSGDCSLTNVDEVSRTIEYIFPNPSQGRFQINTPSLINTISIFDLTGQLVFYSSQTVESYDLSHLNTGIYIVKIKTEGQKEIIQKLVLR